jgi:hypothetical protein
MESSFEHPGRGVTPQYISKTRDYWYTELLKDMRKLEDEICLEYTVHKYGFVQGLDDEQCRAFFKALKQGYDEQTMFDDARDFVVKDRRSVFKAMGTVLHPDDPTLTDAILDEKTRIKDPWESPDPVREDPEGDRRVTLVTTKQNAVKDVMTRLKQKGSEYLCKALAEPDMWALVNDAETHKMVKADYAHHLAASTLGQITTLQRVVRESRTGGPGGS